MVVVAPPVGAGPVDTGGLVPPNDLITPNSTGCSALAIFASPEALGCTPSRRSAVVNPVAVSAIVMGEAGVVRPEAQAGMAELMAEMAAVEPIPRGITRSTLGCVRSGG